MNQQNPMLRLWELGEAQHGSLIRAILSAVVGVLCGMAPYFAAAQIILGLLSGNQEFSFYLTWCAVALAGFLLRASLYSLALSISHKATFSILKSIREKILEKLPKMPLGTILDTSSGQMKQVIVDQVESMERPPGPSAAGDDRQRAGAGVHPRLPVRIGLEDGPAEPGVHPGGHGLHDGGNGQLRQAVRGLRQDHPGHEQRHRGVHRRH